MNFRIQQFGSVDEAVLHLTVILDRQKMKNSGLAN
jgi:hypothetical protein